MLDSHVFRSYFVPDAKDTMGPRSLSLLILALLVSSVPQASTLAGTAEPTKVDFNRDIRPILSNNCFQCHGPDKAKRKAGLRLDTEEGMLADLGDGIRAITRAAPDASELLKRVRAVDPDERMPPREKGKVLTARELGLLESWIAQGAPYAGHWSYIKPERPALPLPKNISWPREGLDHFILARLEREGLSPMPEADGPALARRVALDLTGLPPTPEEVEEVLRDDSAEAYERYVDRLLTKRTYGEHWARMWLDLARYADSAGYADDPPRTIWAYRDWVIRAFNSNQPFDEFTVDQIAGDLLPKPTEEQLIGTAFHRNTLTNNEGGTNDEEFRNVAIVDRVNTTMAVWMGTTIACAQCHSHKFDPITQQEYFRLFAIFNNTDDADRRDESPLLKIFTAEQKAKHSDLEAEIAQLRGKLATPTAELEAEELVWRRQLGSPASWTNLHPAAAVSRAGKKMETLDDASVRIESGAKSDVYTVDFVAEKGSPLLDGSGATRTLNAIRLEALTDDSLPNKGPGHAAGNFVLSRVLGSITPPDDAKQTARFVRVSLPGKTKFLSLAEVQVFSGAENIAPAGKASQSSTAYDGPPNLAIDGNTDGDYQRAKSTTHTDSDDDPWWEVDLGAERVVDRLLVWNRVDNNLRSRLDGFRISLLDAARKTVWESAEQKGPKTSVELAISNVRVVRFTAAHADFSQPGFEASNVVADTEKKSAGKKGWAVGGAIGRSHILTLVPASPLELAPGSRLRLVLEQVSPHANHTLGRVRMAVTSNPRVAELAALPTDVRAILHTPAKQRGKDQTATVTRYYLAKVSATLAGTRERISTAEKELAGIKPGTSVPIQRERAANKRRKTFLQHRGNFLDLGAEVTPGLPSAFHPVRLPAKSPEKEIDRRTLASWIVSRDNPLTSRVIVNRFWEKIFGVGLVRTSEEFGSQGELPSHPALLDWLAKEFVAQDWNVKAFLKMLVTSASYRQSSRVTPALLERDPDNRLLARGPRFRLSAEMVRDQSLFVGGLLSPKMYGPPVNPPQPKLGISAAFGGGIDWKTSGGEDKFRRGLYTRWRRSNPYPSMATFDATSREVCTVRRDRTNTPLQALVTMNDEVYVEAAQGLARRILAQQVDDGGDAAIQRTRFAFRTALVRQPHQPELDRLVALFHSVRGRFAGAPETAKQMATVPIGAAPEGVDVIDLAAWTVVGNVLLNLDEMFMKR